MEKQDLKNLLENIYHLLAEEAPPNRSPTETGAEEPSGIPPDRGGQSQRSFLADYDTNEFGPGYYLPEVGPWNGRWIPGFTAVWPPWRWPTGQLPPGDSIGSGFGGRWVQSPYPNPIWPFPQQYYFVYPPGKDGLFPVWLWDGKQFVEQVPSWGCNGHNCWGGGGGGGSGGGSGGGT